MNRTRFTIVCPSYNRSAAIAATIESVLRQTLGDFELLVGSDGSTDDTDDVVAGIGCSDRRVKLLRLPRTGDPGLVREQLCRDISSDYVAYIDHDDLWQEDHLAILGGVLDSGAPLAATGAEYRHHDGATVTLRGRGLLWHPEVAVLDPYAEPSRVAHRTDVLEQSGGWQRAKGGLEDWDLWWRMTGQGIPLQAVDAASAVVTVSGSTRRNSLDYKIVMPLAGTDDQEAAREIVSHWEPAAMGAAFAADFGRWSAEIAGDPRTTTPLPWPASAPAAQDCAAALQVGRTAAVLTPSVFPGGREGWLVGLAAPYVSRRHGRDIAELMALRFPLALAELKSSLSQRLRAL